MTTFPLQQYRMVSGEEVICEVVDWENDDDNVLVRNAMVIEINWDLERDEKIYLFKPWFLYIEREEEVIVVDSKKIMANCAPNELLAIQYLSAVDDAKRIAQERITSHNATQQRKLSVMVDALKQIADKAEEQVNELVEVNNTPSNVIPFFRKDDDEDGTIH